MFSAFKFFAHLGDLLEVEMGGVTPPPSLTPTYYIYGF